MPSAVTAAATKALAAYEGFYSESTRKSWLTNRFVSGAADFITGLWRGTGQGAVTCAQELVLPCAIGAGKLFFDLQNGSLAVSAITGKNADFGLNARAIGKQILDWQDCTHGNGARCAGNATGLLLSTLFGLKGIIAATKATDAAEAATVVTEGGGATEASAAAARAFARTAAPSETEVANAPEAVRVGPGAAAANGPDFTPTMAARNIRFTQSSIGRQFASGGSVIDLARGLASGDVVPTDLPAIRIFQEGGELYSLDNRRLFAGQFADVELPYRWATPEEIASEDWKFTTTNGGIGITMRGVGYFSWIEP